MVQGLGLHLSRFVDATSSLLHDIAWSDVLLDELDEKWREGRENGKRVPSEGGAASALSGIRRTCAATQVLRAAYEDLIPDMPGNDVDDTSHTVAAVDGDAAHISTADQSGGFPVQGIAELGLVLQQPDDYLAEAAEESPEDCLHIVAEMVALRRRKDPDLTVEGLPQRWCTGLGLKRFVDTLGLQLQPRVPGRRGC